MFCSANGLTFQGAPVTFTASVFAPGTVFVPAGQIEFLDAWNLLATLPLDGNGQATLCLRLGAGPHDIVACYIGTADFAASSSQPVPLYVM